MLLKTKYVAIVLSSVLLFYSTVLAREKGRAPFNVGYRIYDLKNVDENGKKKVLTTAVWYPTAEKPIVFKYGQRWIVGRAAPDAPASKAAAPYPLVVFSHGYGGSGTANAFFTEHLASQGFVVAAPDHEDKDKMGRIRGGADGQPNIGQYLRNALKIGRSGRSFVHGAFAYRPKDISVVIDNMLKLNDTKDSPLAGMINRSAIGIAGHSLGAYTSLAVSGALESARDERIKASLFMSGGVFMWRADDYKRIKVPVMFMFGERETGERMRRFVNDKLIDTRRGYDNCRPPKYMLMVKDGTHFTFCQLVFLTARARDNAKTAKEQVRVINTYGAAFFKRYLKGDKAAGERLQKNDPMLVMYEKEESAQ